MVFLFSGKDSNMALVLKLVLGMAAGAGCKFICDAIEKRLLKARNLEYSQSSKENVLLLTVSALTGLLIMLLTPLSANTLYLFIVFMIAELTAVIDIHYRIIPNDLILALIIVRIVFAVPFLFGVPGFPEFKIWQSLLGLVVCFIIFSLPAAMSKKVGAGDIKLAAAMGFCLGLYLSLAAIVMMGLFVLAYSLVQNRMPTLSFFKSMIPMGPFISLGLIVCSVFVTQFNLLGLSLSAFV